MVSFLCLGLPGEFARFKRQKKDVVLFANYLLHELLSYISLPLQLDWGSL
jgi:hypothetical protein